ncbi:MAG: ribosomal protein S18-alanine N-acetyltransferase [Syntrophales bacterium]
MQDGDLEIGEYEEGNIGEIIAIERDSYSTPWSETIFRSEITSPIARILVSRTVGRRGRQVAGYAVYWRVIDEIHLHNIAVRRDLRRRHVASRMLDEAIRCARLEGARWMTLEVRRSNLPAQRFYEKFGFSVQGVRPGYYSDTREDALIMWADLHLTPDGQNATAGAGEGLDD